MIPMPNASTTKKVSRPANAPIGAELAQAFSRLGSNVTQVERNERLVSKEDPEISQMVLESFLDD